MKNLLGRVVAIIAGAVLFVGAFVVSVAFFAVALAIGLVIGGYFFWKTRHLRKQMRQRYDNRDVIEGEVISSSEVTNPAPSTPAAKIRSEP